MDDPLIDGAELAERLEEVTLLDIRYRMGGPPGRETYLAGHLPGAVYVDLDTDLAGAAGVDGEGRHPLPTSEAFEAAMRRVGVRAERPVVCYDDWQGRAAARCWWLLRWAGHPDVRVLDGGYAAWVEADLPVEIGEVEPSSGDLEVGDPHLPTVGPADIAAGLSGVLVDARAPERYRGETEPVDPVAGHIPGAVNVPTESNLREDGTFRDPAELRAAYDGVGDDVVVYCGSGVTACHDLLALARLGIEARLYPGSWSGWVSDRSRPVETGP